MLSPQIKEPQHQTDAKGSNSMEWSPVKQAAYTFALAKHVSVCHPPSNTLLASELCQLVSQYDNCQELPSLALANQLDCYIQHASTVFSKDDKDYIISCIERYRRGIPIHIGRLIRCQLRIEQFKACHDELLSLGVIYIDHQQIQIEDITSFLSPAEWIRWPKNTDGSLCLETEKLKGVSIPLARCIFRPAVNTLSG